MRWPRIRSLALVLLSVLLGLASRRFGAALPTAVATYAGDTLWATMVYWLLAFAMPRVATVKLAIFAYAISASVEFSQRYHAPWLDSLRDTRPGALILGQGFLWSDLVCYAAGVVMAVGIDLTFQRFVHRRPG